MQPCKMLTDAAGDLRMGNLTAAFEEDKGGDWGEDHPAAMSYYIEKKLSCSK